MAGTKAGYRRFYKEAELSGSKCRKSSAATQLQDRPRVKKLPITNNQQVELQNKQHHLQDQQSSITANQNEAKDRIAKPCEDDNEIGKMMCQLVKEQSALSVDLEVFNVKKYSDQCFEKQLKIESRIHKENSLG